MADGSQTRTGVRPTPTLMSIQARSREQSTTIRERMKTSANQTEKFKSMADQMLGAMKGADIDHIQILNSTFPQAKAEFDRNAKDFSGAMVGLVEGFKDLGIVIEQAEKYDPKEAELLQQADALVGRMQGRVTSAQTALADAEKKTTWFGVRRRAVEAAEAELAAAKKQLEAAETNVVNTKDVVARMKRERLQSMSFEQSSQQLQATAQQVIDQAKAGISEMEEDIEAVMASRENLMAELTDLAGKVEFGDKEIKRVKAELDNLRREQADHQENSPQWMELKAQIAEKDTELAQVESERNKAFTLSQDGQRFVELLRTQEGGQRDFLQFTETFIGLLEMGVRERAVFLDSYVGLMRRANSLQAMESYDKFAVATDNRVQEGSVRLRQAARNAIIGRLEGIPEELRLLRELTETDAKGKATFESKLEHLITDWHKNFGTDARYDDPTAQQPA